MSEKKYSWLKCPKSRLYQVYLKFISNIFMISGNIFISSIFNQIAIRLIELFIAFFINIYAEECNI